LTDYTITAKKKLLSFPVHKSSKNNFEIIALNEGHYPPNTVKIMLVDNKKSILLLSKLKHKQKATFAILKQ